MHDCFALCVRTSTFSRPMARLRSDAGSSRQLRAQSLVGTRRSGPLHLHNTNMHQATRDLVSMFMCVVHIDDERPFYDSGRVTDDLAVACDSWLTLDLSAPSTSSSSFLL